MANCKWWAGDREETGCFVIGNTILDLPQHLLYTAFSRGYLLNNKIGRFQIEQWRNNS